MIDGMAIERQIRAMRQQSRGCEAPRKKESNRALLIRENSNGEENHARRTLRGGASDFSIKKRKADIAGGTHPRDPPTNRTREQRDAMNPSDGNGYGKFPTEGTKKPGAHPYQYETGKIVERGPKKENVRGREKAKGRADGREWGSLMEKLGASRLLSSPGLRAPYGQNSESNRNE